MAGNYSQTIVKLVSIVSMQRLWFYGSRRQIGVLVYHFILYHKVRHVEFENANSRTLHLSGM